MSDIRRDLSGHIKFSHGMLEYWFLNRLLFVVFIAQYELGNEPLSQTPRGPMGLFYDIGDGRNKTLMYRLL